MKINESMNISMIIKKRKKKKINNCLEIRIYSIKIYKNRMNKK